MDGDSSDKQVPPPVTTTTMNGNGTHRENGYVTNVDSVNRFGFTKLPYREPIDLQFKDVTYTVKMGWNKGNLELNFHTRVSVSVYICPHYPFSLDK